MLQLCLLYHLESSGDKDGVHGSRFGGHFGSFQNHPNSVAICLESLISPFGIIETQKPTPKHQNKSANLLSLLEPYWEIFKAHAGEYKETQWRSPPIVQITMACGALLWWLGQMFSQWVIANGPNHSLGVPWRGGEEIDLLHDIYTIFGGDMVHQWLLLVN